MEELTIIIQFKPRDSGNLVSLAYEHPNLLFNQQASAEHYILYFKIAWETYDQAPKASSFGS